LIHESTNKEFNTYLVSYFLIPFGDEREICKALLSNTENLDCTEEYLLGSPALVNSITLFSLSSYN
jgi:hypothetical protein